MVPMLHEMYDGLRVEHGEAAPAWAFIYVEEAHALDEWPISSSRYHPTGEVVAVAQAKTVDDRAEAATHFADLYQLRLPVFLDTLDNEFQTTYGAWPLRFYVFEASTLGYKAMPAECTYSISDLWAAASAACTRTASAR
ncbi:iodothyronine deiodinase [Thecamonas trahens ATCC 50062]|uniref:Iodothyronine deiodinase n=1 Tax=Thecamonas trahens ATCC 50062 TaxID=461836 RepID=A0A0L0D1T2_THETB|nr:iodothyronine deiodinase [Thecamonas trahens ATCC 50062]KNC46227.1 iodothyronine deiodinase [Thecamonas trahens ATCC 50062]|eukprot:XP_013760524.1 iodothyronine deiodinase [Thecamonas trahens ATCC 50062]